MPKYDPAEVLAELTGDNRTEQEAATHFALACTPCSCGANCDHIAGEEA